jgi:hypothetical protein
MQEVEAKRLIKIRDQQNLPDGDPNKKTKYIRVQT